MRRAEVDLGRARVGEEPGGVEVVRKKDPMKRDGRSSRRAEKHSKRETMAV